MRIALDIDGVVADLTPAFLDHGRRIGAFPDTLEVRDERVTSWDFGPYAPYTRQIWRDVMREPYAFWRTLDVLDRPWFEPTCYLSARTFPADVSAEWIAARGLPRAPVYHTRQPKHEVVGRLGIDLLVDDRPATFLEFARRGLACALRSHPYNAEIDAGPARITSLAELTDDRLVAIMNHVNHLKEQFA